MRIQAKINQFKYPILIGSDLLKTLPKEITKLTKSKKRVNDLIIKDLKKNHVDINENIMIGKSGDLLLCDTSSCFHFGSRLGNKPRFILAFQFVTPFGFSMDWDWKNYEKLPFKGLNCDKVESTMKVLGNKI